MKYTEQQTQTGMWSSLQLTKSNDFQFQALIHSLSSRWWQGPDPRYSMACTRCWHSCRPNFGKQGTRQGMGCCGSHSGVGSVPQEHGSISCVCQAWILLSVILHSWKQSKSPAVMVWQSKL